MPTIEDLRASGWRGLIDGKSGPIDLRVVLSAAAREHLAAGREGAGNALWLLSDAASMRLKGTKTQQPFNPLISLEGTRTALTDDFPVATVDLFAEFLPEVDHTYLRARLADLVWTLKRPRDAAFARIAIDAYAHFPISMDTWLRDSKEAWQRALALSRSIKDEARTKMVVDKLLAAFSLTNTEAGWLALWLSQTIDDQGLGEDREAEIAEKLEALGESLERAGVPDKALQHFEGAAMWFHRAVRHEVSARMLSRVADLWLQRCNPPGAPAQPAAFAAHHFVENAIQTLRRIPRAQRDALNVHARLGELYRKLSELGAATLDEMKEIPLPTTDFSADTARAEASVRGKPLLDALLAFATLYAGAKVVDERKQAEERMRNSPLQGLFGASHLSNDGRVIAKSPGYDFNDSGSAEAPIQAEMLRNYTLYTGIVTQVCIWPALQVLVHEHRITEADLLDLARGSPIVPPGRGGLVAKALYEGFEFDFTSAVHIAVPQVEHLVRHHLKRAGARTTTLDARGIETENGLSTLMDLEEGKTVFGTDLSFEIKSIFCQPSGPNLRNMVAHGLLEDGSFHSAQPIYAWWWFFKLVFSTYWNANQAAIKGARRPAG